MIYCEAVFRQGPMNLSLSGGLKSGSLDSPDIAQPNIPESSSYTTQMPGIFTYIHLAKKIWQI